MCSDPYFAWAAGQAGLSHPFAAGRGDALKAQLVRAAIAGVEAIWDVPPGTRLVHPDPVIHVVADPARPWGATDAEGFRRAQYRGWDIRCGRLRPGLGGDPRYRDPLGANYYPWDQWVYAGGRRVTGSSSRRTGGRPTYARCRTGIETL